MLSLLWSTVGTNMSMCLNFLITTQTMHIKDMGVSHPFEMF